MLVVSPEEKAIFPERFHSDRYSQITVQDVKPKNAFIKNCQFPLQAQSASTESCVTMRSQMRHTTHNHTFQKAHTFFCDSWAGATTLQRLPVIRESGANLFAFWEAHLWPVPCSVEIEFIVNNVNTHTANTKVYWYASNPDTTHKNNGKLELKEISDTSL